MSSGYSDIDPSEDTERPPMADWFSDIGDVTATSIRPRILKEGSFWREGCARDVVPTRVGADRTGGGAQAIRGRGYPAFDRTR
jgi:hypothetical protein